MRILFIYKLPTPNIIEPHGIMSLSAVLKQHGHRVDVLVTQLEKDLFKSVAEFSPHMIAYSVTTGFQDYYINLNKRLKKNFDFLSIFGGPHPTFYPEMINGEGIDVICRGEGEYALLELINNLERGESPIGIDNIWIKKDGRVYKSKLRKLIENLDKLPLPDRGLFDKYKEFKYNPIKHVIISRGCNFNCSYCFNHKFRELHNHPEPYVRKKSVKMTIEELEYIKRRYRVEFIEFFDDNFAYQPNKNWMGEFSAAYSMKIGIPFHCSVRLETLNDDVIRHLKKGGCRSIGFGIESGNEHLRKNVLRRDISNKETIKKCHLIKKYGISITTTNMIGIPEEKIENVFETIALNIKCKPVYGWVSFCTPYPKTDLEAFAIAHGFTKDLNRIKSLYHYEPILTIKNKKEFQNLHYLFSIFIKFPFLFRNFKSLIRLNLTPLYKLIFVLLKVYSYTKLKSIHFDMNFILLYMKFVGNK